MSADHQTLIAEALAGHRADDVGRDCIGDGMAWVYARRCDCGWRGPSDQHDAHVAAALLDSPEFAAVLADVRAGALREAAEVMPFGYSHAAAILRERARADERTSHE